MSVAGLSSLYRVISQREWHYGIHTSFSVEPSNNTKLHRNPSPLMSNEFHRGAENKYLQPVSVQFVQFVRFVYKIQIITYKIVSGWEKV